MEETRKGLEKEHCARYSQALTTVPRMMVMKGESTCIEVSKDI